MVVYDPNLQFVNEWTDRMTKYFGIYVFYTKDGQTLDDGQFTTYVARGPKWNESLDKEPDPTDSDILRLKEFEKNLPDLPDWLEIPDDIIKEIMNKIDEIGED